jgi:hypothetical protein
VVVSVEVEVEVGVGVGEGVVVVSMVVVSVEVEVEVGVVVVSMVLVSVMVAVVDVVVVDGERAHVPCVCMPVESRRQQLSWSSCLLTCLWGCAGSWRGRGGSGGRGWVSNEQWGQVVVRVRL